MAEHIKIPLLPLSGPRINYFVGAVPTAVFTIPFPFFEPADIQVSVDGVRNTLDVDYSIVPSGGFANGFPGGLVAFGIAKTNATVFIERVIPIQRVTDFPASGPLQTNSLNTELDRIIAILQQLEGEITALDVRVDVLEVGDPRLGRAMLFPPLDPVSKTLPEIPDRADQVLGFDSGGNIDMQSALIDPSSPRNVVLPPAAGRVNKVLGWDSSGQFINMVDVVAGALVPDAGNLSYTAIPSSGISRSVEDRLRERISIKDFGTQVGEGVQANDDAALAAAITYINSLATIGITLYYPPGIYFHAACPVRLLKSFTCIEGEGESSYINLTGGTWLRVGDPATGTAGQTKRISIRKLVFDCTNATGQSIVAALESTFDTWFSDIHIIGADTFLTLGTVGGPGAFHINVVHCSGTSRNNGVPIFDLFSGGGLWLNQVNFSVDFDVRPRPSSVIFIKSQVVSFTVVRVLQCYCYGFSYGLFLIANGGGLASDYIVTNSTFTGIQNSAIYLEHGNNGTLTNVRIINNNLDCLDSHCIGIGNAGGNTVCNNLQFNSNVITGAGLSAFATSTGAATISFSGNRITNCNQKGTADAAIQIFGGSGYNISENSGNFFEGGPGASQCPVGIHIGAGTDVYMVSNNRMAGTAHSIQVDPDSLLSGQRRVHNNLFAQGVFGGYAVIVPLPIDAGGNYGNTTPYVICASFSGGTGIDAVTVNSVRVLYGALNGGPFTVMIEPGDVIGSNATATPALIGRIMA